VLYAYYMCVILPWVLLMVLVMELEFQLCWGAWRLCVHNNCVAMPFVLHIPIKMGARKIALSSNGPYMYEYMIEFIQALTSRFFYTFKQNAACKSKQN